MHSLSNPNGEKGLRHHSNAGLFTPNQTELINELKRIELSRRQYELAYVHEQRKLITRVANKLIHSNANLDAIFKRPTSVTSKRKQAQLKQQMQANADADAMVDEEDEEHESTPPLQPRVSLRRGITYIGFSSSRNRSSQQSLLSTTSRPITSLLPPQSITVEEDNTAAAAAAEVLKKRVKWRRGGGGSNDDDIMSETPKQLSRTLSTQQTKSRLISMYELNKRYDELRMKYPDRQPKVFLPLLVSSSRRNESAINSARSGGPSRPSSQMVAALDEGHRRRLDECKHTFMNMIDADDSGFYSYKDANGQPICLGYDNYAVLLRSNRSNLRNISSSSSQDPITISSAHLNSNKTAKQQQHSYNRLDELVADPDPDLIRLKVEEENRLCKDTFRAQTIRSLTFKNVITY